jgi:hypothetical protein
VLNADAAGVVVAPNGEAETVVAPNAPVPNGVDVDAAGVGVSDFFSSTGFTGSGSAGLSAAGVSKEEPKVAPPKGEVPEPNGDGVAFVVTPNPGVLKDVGKDVEAGALSVVSLAVGEVF